MVAYSCWKGTGHSTPSYIAWYGIASTWGILALFLNLNFGMYSLLMVKSVNVLKRQVTFWNGNRSFSFTETLKKILPNGKVTHNRHHPAAVTSERSFLYYSFFNYFLFHIIWLFVFSFDNDYLIFLLYLNHFPIAKFLVYFQFY